MQESGWKFAEVDPGCKKDSSKRQVYFLMQNPKVSHELEVPFNTDISCEVWSGKQGVAGVSG